MTAKEMGETDRQTTERYGLPSLLLMENAARAVAEAVLDRTASLDRQPRVVVLCGKGNNGGDGAAVGRLLSMFDADVEVHLFGEISETKGDARTNFEIVKAMPGIRFVENAEEMPSVKDLDVVIDALFGTGLSRPVEGRLLSVIKELEHLAESGERPLIAAVDIPSGLFSDEPDAETHSVKADLTVAFTAAKPANVMPPAYLRCGELLIADIGTPPELIAELAGPLFAAEAADAAAFLEATEFSHDSYKNKRGHCLIAAGSENYSGAAVLAANAAMRSGAGLVTLAVPQTIFDITAERILPEVMLRAAETADGAFAANARDGMQDLLDRADAVAIGCGVGLTEDAADLVQKMLAGRTQPMIVDADALTLLSPFDGHRFSGGPQLILTPHEGEFRRLAGIVEKNGGIADRVGIARRFAAANGVILILKGERTLIAAPDGRVVINTTGNPGIGKAGNGDTLAGILAGFVTQASAMGADIFSACVAAVYTAGLAADIAANKFGMRTMTASDVRECLADAYLLIAEGVKI